MFFLSLRPDLPPWASAQTGWPSTGMDCSPSLVGSCHQGALLLGERKHQGPKEAAEAALCDPLQAQHSTTHRVEGLRETGPGPSRTRPTGHRVFRRERLAHRGCKDGRRAHPTLPGAPVPAGSRSTFPPTLRPGEPGRPAPHDTEHPQEEAS